MALGDLKSYDPAKVSVIVGGSRMEGFADGSFVEISRDTDEFTDAAGADGEVARSKQNDTRGTITLTLLQTSLSNTVLSGLAKSGAVVPVLVSELGSGSTYDSDNAWVMKMADSAFSKNIETRQWRIRCAKLNFAVEGTATDFLL